MNLDGTDLKRLRDAFVASYDADSLSELLAFRLNSRLDSLVAVNANFETVVFRLLGRAEREGWLRELIEKAAEDRSGNAKFVAICESLLGQSVPEQEGDTRLGPAPENSTAQQDTIRPEELRRVMTERLNRGEVSALWFDLFASILDNDLPGRPLQECVVGLIARARQRHKFDTLVEAVRESYPHVLASLSSTKPASQAIRHSTSSPSAAVTVDEDRLVAFLEGLTPSDFARILVRLPGAANQVSDNTTHLERVAALMRYVRSSGGPGLPRLVRVVESLFPNAPGFG
jgi:hypothetical protein